ERGADLLAFFFQAEDGIRDFHVTGVQTCALPIFPQAMAETLIGWNLSPMAFLLAVNILLLLFGIFLEPLPGVMILVPILAPIAADRKSVAEGKRGEGRGGGRLRRAREGR